MKYVINFLIAFTALQANAQLKNVEHFYARSAQAEKLYHFFADNFSLPAVWRYQSWKEYASGGLMLGNTPLEFIQFANDTSTNTLFRGIALEPTVRVDSLMRLYDKAGVAYGKPFVDTFTENGVKDTGFINLRIKNVLPDDVYFFTCDYKYRGETDTAEMNAADSLRRIGGGNLGIKTLKEIVVGCNDVEACSRELSKLPGIKKEEDDLFRFSRGPALRLVGSKDSGIQKIVVAVYSLSKARTYLQRKNLLGQATINSVFIRASAIGGLLIELTEN